MKCMHMCMWYVFVCVHVYEGVCVACVCIDACVFVCVYEYIDCVCICSGMCVHGDAVCGCACVHVQVSSSRSSR